MRDAIDLLPGNGGWTGDAASADRGRVRTSWPVTIRDLLNRLHLMDGMITAARIASLIEDAPAWALIGLAATGESLRAAGQLEVAQHVYSGLSQPMNVEATQIALPW